MPAEISTTAEVARVLRMHQFHFHNEAELQRGIEEALTLAGAPFEREYKLDARSRIDFMVVGRERVGIEVKIAGAPSEVDRQIRRYLKHPHVEGLVLVTTRRKHRSLGGHYVKPVEVVWLSLGAL